MTESSIPGPPHPLTQERAERRIGFELEYAGVQPEQALASIQAEYGGDIRQSTEFEYEVRGTELGNFRLELDADYFKQKAREEEKDNSSDDGKDWQRWSKDLLSAAAQLVVPWEIVTDPIPLSCLHRLDPLCAELRANGALGTRHSVLYAFGVHLNPELPDLTAETVLGYLRAYFCLYDWLHERETVDMTRKITPYIDPFPKQYVLRVIAEGYQPDRSGLIDDYLQHNPTRNRSLDMLPLFAYLDKQRVLDAVDDPRIKPRPTLHYRLPNSDVDRSGWSLLSPWRDWLQVEFLAADSDRLRAVCDAFMEDLGRLTRDLDGRWARDSQKWLVDLASA